MATTVTWTGGSSGDWNTGGNWTGNSGNPPTGITYVSLDPVDYGSFVVTVSDSETGGRLIWKTSVSDTAEIDIVSGGYLTVGLPGGGGTFAGSPAGASIVLSSAGSGSTLQIGQGFGLTATNNTGSPTSVVFANNGAADAVVFWDNKTVLDSSNIQMSLTGFGQHDTLDVATAGPVTFSGTSYVGGVLTVTGTNVDGAFTASVAIQGGSATPSDFTATYNAGGYVQITSDLPCFLRGTRIATLRGEVPVEALHIGDLVVTASGGALPIKWIGTRGFITGLVNEHHRAGLLPIRIAAGALGEACPVRDLHVSPEHMLCLDEVLIPAEKLLNGTTITRADDFDVVQYFHIELIRHAVLYAEGAPAESFLDTGNRNMFANVLSYLELGYDLTAPPLPPCLPIVTEGETLAAVRARLAERAASLGLATTEDDGLYLRVDGVAIRPESRDDTGVRFTVPAGARQVHIVSRSVIPADLDPGCGDHRCLGVPLSGMVLRDDTSVLEFGPGHAGFVTGFYAAEPTHRWTSGNALLPEDLVAAMPDGFTLELKVVRCGLHYPAPKQAEVIPFATRRSA